MIVSAQSGHFFVADVPEAVWHNTAAGPRKLLYLAHTHIPTLWDEQGRTLPPLEWTTTPDGSLEVSRALPNEVTLTSRVTPGLRRTRIEPLAGSVALTSWMRSAR